MGARLFEDLVVSAPPAGRFGRRAAILPLSIAAHAGALALALLFPVLRSADLPDPAAGILTLSVPSAPTPPPPLPTSTPAPPRVRSESVSHESRPTAVTEAVEPPPAPGPTVSVIEPEGPPLEESHPPCLFNCAGSTPDGRGDGPRGGPTSPEATEGTGNGPIRITGGDIKPPVRTAYVAPVYPEIARAARVSGTVVVECTIDPFGRVVDARVITGHPLLNESALDAVRQWRYEPTRLNRVPVAVLMTVTVRFIAQR
jgi:periplasmic protein TonB